MNTTTRGALLLVAGLTLAGCGPAAYESSSPATAVTAAAAPQPVAPPKPENLCERGTLAACAESCRAGADGACDDLGKRTCKEGSVLECQAACDGNEIAACDALAEMYRDGERVERDYAKAVALHARACDRGVRSSCTAAGDVVRQEMEVEGADRVSLTLDAIRYFDAGCDRAKPDDGDWTNWEIWPEGPSHNACAQLLLLAPERVLPALEAKCAHGSAPPEDREPTPDACVILAYGKGLPRDAAELGLRRLCARDPRSESCGRLKDLAVSGRGGVP